MIWVFNKVGEELGLVFVRVLKVCLRSLVLFYGSGVWEGLMLRFRKF